MRTKIGPSWRSILTPLPTRHPIVILLMDTMRLTKWDGSIIVVIGVSIVYWLFHRILIDFVNQQWDYRFEKELLFQNLIGGENKAIAESNHPIIQLSHAPTQPFSWSKSFFHPKPSAGSGSCDWHTQRQLVDPRLTNCLLHNYAMVERQTMQVNLNIILIYVYKYIYI